MMNSISKVHTQQQLINTKNEIQIGHKYKLNFTQVTSLQNKRDEVCHNLQRKHSDAQLQMDMKPESMVTEL